MLYPLVLSPVCKDYLWGGVKLTRLFKNYNMDRIAEGWVLADHEQGIASIQNGEYSGFNFHSYLEKQQQSVIGQGLNNELPVLIKLIDSSDSLSIQVHPDDFYARVHESSEGKTEFWYILDCEKDAFIYYGFSSSFTIDI